jgi:hypothetical protein
MTDDGPEVYERTVEEWSPKVAPSSEVVDAVASARGVAISELPPLHDVVDPDALDSLLSNVEGRAVELAFTYFGFVVRLDGSGYLRLERRRS